MKAFTSGALAGDAFLLGLFSLLLLAILSAWAGSWVPKGLRLPPGPPGKFIMGNAGDLPKEQEWATFAKWAKVYGDLVYIKVFGQGMVFVNSAEVAYDIFEKASSIYSDRSDSPMLNDLMGFDWHLTFMRYGNWWRRHRKLFHQKFHPAAATEYYPIQIGRTQELLQRLYETPSDFAEHLRHAAGAIIMEIIYGIKVQPKNDHYITTAETAMFGMTVAGNSGTFLVDTIPMLKYVPAWMPGANFRRLANKWRRATTDMSLAPFQAVKRAMAEGTAAPSFTASFLEELSHRTDKPVDEEEVIRGAGSSAYAAGSDTTVSALHTFILAMVCFPEVQRKAHAELDRVMGSHRLPGFGDRESLQYIDLICKEVHRWQPVVPMGVAHAVTRDDTYGGYFIPKGTLIIGNIWHMLHDEQKYGPDPDKFIPERFLASGVKDSNIAFGFGRRICPGRYMADNSIFIAVASILTVFHITPARDGNGNEIPVKATFTSGLMSHPEKFQCEFKIRSDAAKTLIFDKVDI